MRRCIVLVGLSASGKTTVKDLLVSAGLVRYGVTCTTRPPREGKEQNGVDYDFLTAEEWAEAVAADRLAEKTSYMSNKAHKYGIFVNRIQEADAARLPTVWILDTNGLEWMRERYGRRHVLSVALVTERETLRWRMHRRGEAEAEIAKRLANYEEERVAALLACDASFDTSKLTPEHVAWNVLTLMGV